MKRIPSWLIGFLTIAAFIFAFYGIARAVWIAPTESEITVPTISHRRPGVYPATLNIPALGVNAHIQQVGLGKSGRIGVPNNYSDVAWYKNGPMPGEAGAAIIVGHIDNGFGLPGVFKRLPQIEIGAEITVVDTDGTSHVYTVESKQSVPYTGKEKDILPTGSGAKLIIITCVGDWLPEQKMYTERLVVTAGLAK